MAVYTRIGTEELERFLAGFDIGRLTSCKGIAEGVENSNYLIETDAEHYILTIYENRTNPEDLPFFLALLDHLHDSGCAVPRFIPDREGRQIHRLAGKHACLIEFLPGLSVSQPTAAQAHSVGQALGKMHLALENFSEERTNDLSLNGWRELFGKCARADLDELADGLSDDIESELEFLFANWPRDLRRSVIHADLFPDNVLMLDNNVSGLIDFYFACSDIRAYDIAVTHAAWCFSDDGSRYHAEIGEGLMRGYGETMPLTAEERAALPILARGASMRFLITRAYDWINTPADALVVRKDPLAFRRRLDFYRKAEPGTDNPFGAAQA